MTADRQHVGFAIRPDEGGGFELLTDELGIAHDRFGVYILLHGRPVANVTEDEADRIARVLPWHASQARKLRSRVGGQA